MPSSDYCIPVDQTSAETDMAALRTELWESFKLAFQAQMANGTQDEWELWENAEGWFDDWSKPDTWFGSPYDSKGESVHPTHYQKEGSVKLYTWKKTAITNASFANLKSTFGCNVNPNGMMAVASERLRQWLVDQTNAFARASAGTEGGAALGGDEIEAAAMATADMINPLNSAEEQAAGAAGTIANIDAAHQAAEEVADIMLGEYSDIEFKEQCFLLAKIFDLWEHKVASETREVKKLPYVDGAPNSSLMIDGNPYAFMNKLTQYPTQQALMNMTNADISNLQPRIRLFKVHTDSKGVESSQEINFAGSATDQDLELMLAKTGKRGFGCGIKDFTFAYEANNPFGLKKSITARLTLFANTFDELLRERDGSYRYVDLALKTGGGSGDNSAVFRSAGLSAQDAEIAAGNLSKLDFRLKAVVGLETPLTDGGISNSTVLTAVQNSFVTLNLTPTTHEFEFDEMGRVNFSINYLAYVDDFFDQQEYSIFGSTIVAKELYYRRLQMQAANASCSSEQVKQFKQQQAAALQSTKNMAYTYLFKQLTIKNKLRYVTIPHGDLQKFNSQGPFYELMEGAMTNLDVGDLSNSQKLTFSKEVQEELKEKNEAPAEGGDKPIDPEEEKQRTVSRIASGTDTEQVIFFYISDLIDVILEGIEEKLNPSKDGAASGMHAIIDGLADSTSAAAAQNGGLGKQIEELHERAMAAWEAGDDATAMQLEEDIIALEAELSAKALETGSAEEQAAALLSVGDLAAKEKERFSRLYDNFKKFRVLLGPVEITNPKDPANSAFINFGDIPISAKYFMDWLLDQTVKKEEFYYPIPRFMNDFFNRFVSDFLNNDTCFGYSVKQKTRVQQAAVTAYRITSENNNIDTIASKIVQQRQENGSNMISRLMLWNEVPPLLNVSGGIEDPRGYARHLGNEYNYLVYFAGRTQPLEKMNGDAAEDADQGIMHYILGRPDGIIKNINLKRTEAPGLKEVRFEQEGFDGLNQLREVYDVEIETYANVSAFPGVYLFVDPRGFVPNMDYSLYAAGFNINDLSDYGLGGYYMIIRSEHSFGPGKADTVLTAKWVSEIHKNVDAAEGEASSEGSAPPASKPTKCYLKENRRKEENGYFSILAMLPGFDGFDDVDTGELPTEGGD
mgnify:CR=1 FL=1